VDENNETADDEIQSINVKLFLWAVFFDHYNLSLHFWRRLNVSLKSMFDRKCFFRLGSIVRCSCGCTCLSTYSGIMCQTKFDRNYNCREIKRSCGVRKMERFEIC
jgi:hypothetical protein